MPSDTDLSLAPPPPGFVSCAPPPLDHDAANGGCPPASRLGHLMQAQNECRDWAGCGQQQTLAPAAGNEVARSEAMLLTKKAELSGAFQRYLVEPSGIEPLTSCMPCRRSPS